MSDKEENAPIASPADVPAASDTAKTETASAASAEDPKAEEDTAAPAVKEEEKPEVDMKATGSGLAKDEDTKPADGKHALLQTTPHMRLIPPPQLCNCVTYLLTVAHSNRILREAHQDRACQY